MADMDYKERLLVECNELKEKIENLDEFLKSRKLTSLLNSDDLDLLYIQLEIMISYKTILSIRINRI